MSDKQLESIYEGLTYGGLAFGALAVLAPRAFTAIYGLKGDGNLNVMVRLWGTRTALISGLAMRTKQSQVRKDLVTAIVAMNFTDAALTVTAGSDVRVRTRFLGAATSALFGAGGAYWISQS
jgi:hypothetical protein